MTDSQRQQEEGRGRALDKTVSESQAVRLPSIIVDPALSKQPNEPVNEQAAPANGSSRASKTDNAGGEKMSVDVEASATQPAQPSSGQTATEASVDAPVSGGAVAAAEPEPASEARAEAAPADAQVPPAAETPVGQEDGQDTSELSDQDAERFAAGIRASWEAPPLAPSSRPAPALSSAPEADPFATAADALPDIGLVSLGQRKRALMWTASAVVGFGVLVGLGLWSSQSSNKPEAWNNDGQTEPQNEQATAEPLLEPSAAAAGQANAAAPTDEPEPSTAAASDEGLVATADQEALTAPASEEVPTTAEPGTETAAQEAQADAPEQPVPAEPEHAAEQGAATAAVATPPTEAAAPEATSRNAKRVRKPARSPRSHAAATRSPREDKPALARIHVTTNPSRAQLTLDGHPVSNPYLVHVPQTAARHRFEAHAEGYKSRSIDVDYARDHSVTLRLRRESPPKPARARKPAEQPSRGAGFVSESPY